VPSSVVIVFGENRKPYGREAATFRDLRAAGIRASGFRLCA
jgi:hypothetical protein